MVLLNSKHLLPCSVTYEDDTKYLCSCLSQFEKNPAIWRQGENRLSNVQVRKFVTPKHGAAANKFFSELGVSNATKRDRNVEGTEDLYTYPMRVPTEFAKCLTFLDAQALAGSAMATARVQL